MPTVTDTRLLSFAGWTLRLREAQTPNPRLLLLLHGWTGDENSMWVFTRRFPPSYQVIAPRAPYQANPSGYSWRPVSSSSFGFPTISTLAPAAADLLKLIDAYSASLGLSSTTFDDVGFSQGAAMVNVLGLLYPRRLQKMAILAGFLPAEAQPWLAQKPLQGRHIFVAHGTRDSIIPFDRACTSITQLEQAGAQVTFHQEDIGHKMGAHGIRALENYLSLPGGD